MRINNNPSSMYTLYNNVSHKQNVKATEKLASGLAINRAANNPAGLAISEQLRAEILGMNKATQNTQDGISLIQTADGALAEDNSILNRMKELSVQAANGIYTDDQRQAIQKEIDQLKSGMNDIANNTSFNHKNLLDGSINRVTIQAGPNELQNMGIPMEKMDAGTNGVGSLTVTDTSSAGKAITSVDQAIARVTSGRSTYGATQNNLQHNMNYLGIAEENQIAAESKIRDADIAAAIMDYTRTNILQNVNNAVSAQANLQAGQVLRLLG